MNNLKVCLLLFGLFYHGLGHAESAILTIVPNYTSVSVRSDSSTNVSYRVTNQTNQPLNHLTIHAPYQTTGNANGISVDSASNTCTSILLPGATCQFNIIIQGANQPSQFQITPEVCGYNRLFCNKPTPNNYLQVAVTAITDKAFAYYAISSGSNANRLISVNSATLAVGTPMSIDSTKDIRNQVAVTANGQTVYAAQISSGGIADVLVLSAGFRPQIRQTLSLGYMPYFDALIVSKDGKQIYAASSQDSGYYRIDNDNDSYSANFVSVPSGEQVSGLALSPDGKRLFITSYGQNRFYVMDALTNTHLQTLNNVGTSCEFDAPGALVVSPNGHTIYVANGYGVEGIPVINQNPDGSYSCGSRLTESTQQLTSITISANGRYLYALGYNAPQLLYIFNATTNTLLASYALTTDYSFTGISLIPDGSKIFISSNNGAYYFSLINGLPTSDTPTHIDVGGGSQTNGDFVG
jgi:WD40 repeat protein